MRFWGKRSDAATQRHEANELRMHRQANPNRAWAAGRVCGTPAVAGTLPHALSMEGATVDAGQHPRRSASPQAWPSPLHFPWALERVQLGASLGCSLHSTRDRLLVALRLQLAIDSGNRTEGPSRDHGKCGALHSACCA